MFHPLGAKQWLLLAVAFMALAAVPLVTDDPYFLHLMILSMLFGLLASS